MNLVGNRLRLGAAALLTTIALGAIITPGIASAGNPIVAPSVEHLETGNDGDCYEQITQYRYQKYDVEYEYVKETRERTGNGAQWSTWTVWDGGSTTRWEGADFSDEGHHGGTHDHPTKYDRDYRYVRTGETRQTTVGQPTDWLALPPNDGNQWNVIDERTGPYGAEVPCDDVDTKKVTLCHATASETNPYNKITVSVSAFLNAGHISHDGDVYAAFSYVKHGQTHNVASKGDLSLLQYEECARPKPEEPDFPPEVVEQFGDCAVGAPTVSGTRTTTGFKAVFNPQTWTWDKVQDGLPIVENISRPLNEAEIQSCQPSYPPVVNVTEGDCATGDSAITVTTTTKNFTAVYIGGVWTKVPDGDPLVITATRQLDEQEQAACKPTYEPVVQVTEGDCSAGDSAVSVVTTTTKFTAVYTDGAWTKVQDGDPVVGQTTRPLTPEEHAECQPSMQPKVERQDVGAPVCGATTIQVQVATTTYSYAYNEQTGSWEQTTETTVAYETRNLTAEEQHPCPTYGLSVVCTSAGPDYGAWLVNNNANQNATVDGVSIPPGGNHVFNVVADAVTFPVTWNDGLNASLSSQGENDCTYEPPVTTQPPTPTTQPPTETTQPPTETTQPPVTTPPTETTQPPVTTPPTETTQPPATTPETTLDISAIGPVCLRDAPYIEVTFGAQSQFNDLPATVSLVDLDGNVVGTDSATYRSGTTVRFVYPGASVDAAGNATDWPGWMFDGDEWVVDPSDARLRDGLSVVIEVNPTATATVSYPPATATCASPLQTPDPTTAVAPPSGQLPQTGSSTAVVAIAATVLLLAGGATLLATRRSATQH